MMAEFYLRLRAWWSSVTSDEAGQDLAEYGLIVALIAIVCIGALTALGGNLNSTLNTIASSVKGGG